MAKTRKSVTKRFKTTKTGTTFKRAVGLNHFLAKKSAKKKRESKKMSRLYRGEIKRIKRFGKITK